MLLSSIVSKAAKYIADGHWQRCTPDMQTTKRKKVQKESLQHWGRLYWGTLGRPVASQYTALLQEDYH